MQVFEAELRVEEAQALKDLRARSRAAQREAEAMEVEIAALEVEAVHLEAISAKRDGTRQRLEALRAEANGVQDLEREVAALAGTEIVLSKLRSRKLELEAKAAMIPMLESQILEKTDTKDTSCASFRLNDLKVSGLLVLHACVDVNGCVLVYVSANMYSMLDTVAHFSATSAFISHMMPIAA